MGISGSDTARSRVCRLRSHCEVSKRLTTAVQRLLNPAWFAWIVLMKKAFEPQENWLAAELPSGL